MPRFSKDIIKESLFDTLGWSDREWSKKLGFASITLLFKLVEIEMAAGRAIIVEGNFKPNQDGRRFHALRQKYSPAIVEVYCTSTEEVLMSRFKARAASANRHPGHVEDNSAAGFQFEELAAAIKSGAYHPMELGGETICVDTTDFAAIDYGDMLDAVRTAVANHYRDNR